MTARLGTVTSFSNGFGYIVPHDGGRDLTFGREDCDRDPAQGSLVSFATRAWAGRPVAEQIKVLR